MPCPECKELIKKLQDDNDQLKRRLSDLQDKKENDDLIHSLRLITIEEKIKRSLREESKCCIS